MGNVMSKEACEHYGRFWVWCPACEKNFCSKCKTTPYHVGFTCEELKRHKEAVKCRFCNKIIEEVKGKVVSNVCNSPHCQSQLNASCKRKHDCGHGCAGFKDERIHPPCLNEACVSTDPSKTLDNNENSWCSICFVEKLGDAPSI